MLASAFVNPPRDFYSTAATVIVTLFVALAIEFRLLQPHPDARLPDDAEERRTATWTILFGLPFPLASVIGFFAAMTALYQGGSKLLGTLAIVGVSAMTVMFFGMSLGVFFKLLGGWIPEDWRKPLGVGLGGALIIAGLLILLVG